MLVQCPGCLTTFRIDDGLIATAEPTFRCSRCRHVFALEPRGRADPQPEPLDDSPHPQPTTAAAEEPSFTFASQQWGNEPGLAGGQAELPLTFPEEKPAVLEAARADEPVEKGSPLDGKDFLPATVEAPAAPEPPPTPLSTVPFIGLLCVLLFTFALATLTHRFRPEPLEILLQNIPWLSASLFHNLHLPQGISLEPVHPAFHTIQGERRVFAISGLAVNRNAVPVREIRLEGIIFNADGKEIERQAITVGNPLSSKIIRAITAQDISILQKLDPPKIFELQPEESAAFVIVFQKPVKEIRGFSYRVVSAVSGSA
jgi:predicted Zn finger-like uncharacterized protein